jgi:CTP synthase (UTP-ammonia lyase)
VRIALVGDEKPVYPSHRELNALRPMLGRNVCAEWVPTDGEQVKDLSDFAGVWLTPGSPYADDASVYEAVKWARDHDIPFLATCGGLQYAVVEYFRNVLDVADASHAESDGAGDSNVIRVLTCSLYGQERVVRPVPGTRFARLVCDRALVGMHYCNYGPGATELERLVEGGMIIEATADGAEAEVIELPSNRFFVLTNFQPQIGVMAGRPVHPLIREFVRCARRSVETRPAGDQAPGRVR